MAMRRLVILLLLLSMPTMLRAQVVDEAIEQWLVDDGDEAAAAELNDQLAQWRDSPFNINDTTALADFPLLDPFQRKALCYYIALYGQLLSVKELLLVPGFDSAVVEQIAPYLIAQPVEPRGQFRPWQGRHSLVAGIGGTVEQAAGYANGRYEGDNMRALLCYNYRYRNQLSLHLAADKDAAESWGKGNYYSYRLVLSNIGALEKLVVGRYNLQFGQGLTLWTGLRPFSILGMSTARYGAGVKAAGTFYEYDYQEGVAATVNVGSGVHLSGFASRVEGESLVGGNAELRRGNLVAGLTATYTSLDDSVVPNNYVYNVHSFRGDRLFNAGVHAAYQWRRVVLHGETAVDGQGHAAVVAGADVVASADNRLGISYRHFDTAYRNLHAQAYAIGSTQAEQGLALNAVIQLPFKVSGLLSVDLHSFPALRYGSYSPSSGAWLRAQLSRQCGHYVLTSVRYAYRQKERNLPYSDSTQYVGETTLRQQVQGDVRYTAGPWQLSARVVYADFESEHGVAQHGWAASAMLRYQAERLRFDLGGVWFDVDGYYARIYHSESTLQYAWTMPVLNGRGYRAHAVVRYAFAENIGVAARYSLLYMPDQEAIGTGDAQTEGPVRQMWHLQLRWKF